jgi:RimJ/RimL family protein N-acetyltransferase
MLIRPAQITDAAAIGAIHVETWRAAYRGQVPDAVLDTLDANRSAAFWQKQIDAGASVFVAENDGVVIGFCDLIPSRDKDANPKEVAEIAAIYVHPHHWRKGAGRALCAHVLAEAKRRSYRALTLWVLASNTSGKRFYEAMGFALDGTEKTGTVMGATNLHEVRFRIALGRPEIRDEGIATEVLILRQWKDSDLAPFAEMNADPEVMRHFPAPLSRAQSESDLNVLRRQIDERGWGLWVVEVNGAFAGFTGLSIPRFNAHFTPCTEVGWRFRREFWGRGLAHRAACEALAYGFDTLTLPEIVSFTAATNVRSQKLMARLGFTHDEREDFDHPSLPEGHHLRRHVLYRKQAASQ